MEKTILEDKISSLERVFATKMPAFYSFLKKGKVRYQKIKYNFLKIIGKDKDVIYDRKFFDRNLEWNIPIAAKFVNIIIKYFNPRSVVDMGCGNAEFLSHFKKAGIVIKGYEGSHYAIDSSLVGKEYIELFDLRKMINSNTKYDLAICLEVAEHVEKRFSEILIENLINLSDVIIFTAAPPGQGGHFHINEQPREFWVNIFKDRNYLYDSEITEKVKSDMKKEKIIWWYCDNLMVFRQRNN